MDGSKIKSIINNVNFDKESKKILKEYEDVVKMFDGLVATGVAEKNKTILSKNSSKIRFEFA